MRFPLATALLAALMLACGPAKPDVEVDGWALARAALVDGHSCYAERTEYCIRDEALIDASIQAALDGRFDGQMPKLSRKVEEVIRSARIDYEKASMEPARIAEIETLVAAYYAEPKVDASSDPELVNVDLGALPGKISIRGRVSTMVLADSPLLEDFRWQGAEAGRVLAKYALAHPDKQIVRVELLIPKGSGEKPLVYRYFRAQQRVVFGELLERSLYMSAPISGGVEAMAAGQLKLDRDALEFCSAPRPASESSGKWCPWQDDYGQAAHDAKNK